MFVPASTPNYVSPPISGSGAPGYYFTSRDAFRWDNTTSTDLAFTYAFVIPVVGSDFQFYLEPRLNNVLNEHAVNYPAGVGTTVYTSRNAGHGLTPFNPFTTTPIQCPTGDTAAQCTALGANYQVSPTFGQPLTPTTASTQGAYQLPRTITISLGVRF